MCTRRKAYRQICHLDFVDSLTISAYLSNQNAHEARPTDSLGTASPSTFSNARSSFKFDSATGTRRFLEQQPHLLTAAATIQFSADGTLPSLRLEDCANLSSAACTEASNHNCLLLICTTFFNSPSNRIINQYNSNAKLQALATSLSQHALGNLRSGHLQASNITCPPPCTKTSSNYLQEVAAERQTDFYSPYTSIPRTANRATINQIT